MENTEILDFVYKINLGSTKEIPAATFNHISQEIFRLLGVKEDINKDVLISYIGEKYPVSTFKTYANTLIAINDNLPVNVYLVAPNNDDSLFILIFDNEKLRYARHKVFNSDVERLSAIDSIKNAKVGILNRELGEEYELKKHIIKKSVLLYSFNFQSNELKSEFEFYNFKQILKYVKMIIKVNVTSNFIDNLKLKNVKLFKELYSIEKVITKNI
jgi:hypothetical protein